MSLVQRTAKKSPRLIAISQLNRQKSIKIGFASIALLLTLTFVFSSIAVTAQQVGLQKLNEQKRKEQETQAKPAVFDAAEPEEKQSAPSFSEPLSTPAQLNDKKDLLLAPLTGTLNIPTDYPTLAAAIADLNTQGVGVGGVTFNVLAGNPQTAPAGGYVIGGTGSLVLTSTGVTSQVTIIGNGNTVTAPTPQVAGTLTDAIFKLVGADWITIQGFTMQENPANTVNTPAGSNTMTEFGVAMFYTTLTDGSQNNTIQNNTISLNRTYLNTFGVYSNTRHSSTSITTSAEVTSATGSNSNNKVYGNNISNVNYGIVFIGAGTTIAAIDTGNDVGGSSAATGNTITNWGGGAALSGYLSLTGSNYCVFMNQQINDNFSFNTITSAALAQTVTTGGFLKNYSIANPVGTISTTINNNTVQVTNNTTGTTTGSVIGINNQGLTTLLATATMSINNNTVQNSVLGGTTATTAGLTAITNLSLPGTLNMNGNSVINNAITATTATTAINAGITNSGAAGTVNINNNIIRSLSSTAASGQTQGIANSGAVTTAINMTGNQLGNAASGFFSSAVASSGNIFGIVNSAGAAAALLTIQNNDLRGITYTGAATAQVLPYNNQTFTGSTNISGNTLTNLSLNTTGSVTMISNSVTHAASTTHNVNNNSIVGAFNKTAAGGTVRFYESFSSSPSSVTETNTGNNFSNVTVTGSTIIAGWRSADGTTPGPRKTVTNNTFTNITGGTGAISSVLYVGFSDNTFAGNNVSGNVISNVSSAGSISGIFTDGQNQNFFDNRINTLSSTGAAAAVIGMQMTAGTTQNLFRNKIYDLQSSDAAGTVSGILISGGTTFTVYNNLIGDLRTPAANLANSINGINITSATTTSNVNVYFNTIYLNATSSGALFGSSGVFHTTNATATTAALNLRNNIIVNNSTANGAGVSAAYRRSSTTLTNYGASSNNNDFFAPAIFTDGTNTDTTIAAYKARVAPRDAASFSENPNFLSTAGANANFLHISAATPTSIESGGAAISGITTDYDSETRNVSTPDVGADEFTGIGIDIAAPSISYTPLANTISTANRTLTATIGDATAVDGGANLPRIYFKKSTDASYVSTQCVMTSGTPQSGTYDCLIDYSLVGGGSVVATDVVQYFVAAQDTLGNFATNPAGGTGTVNSVTFSGTPNSYSILPSIGGNKTVGAGGDYATLTAAVAALNSAELSGPVTLTLTDASYTTPAETFPLTINANNGSSATNTVTIKPATGVTSSITGSAANCLINFNGADFMTIDGSNAVNGTSRDLTITNTNTGTSSAVVCMTSLGAGLGATSDTVKNTNITGTTLTATNGTLFGIFSGTSTISTSSAGADNDNNRVQNNNITKTQIGIYSGGASAANKNTGTVITQNVMNAASPNNLNNGGILVNFDDGVKVTQNDISIFRHDGTTGQTGTAYGIAIGLVPNNSVTSFTGSDVINAEVSRNKINGITQLNSTGYSTMGIAINTVTSGTTLVANNMISGIRSASTASDFSAGILAGGGAGSTTQVYFNSVAMTGTRGAATFPSYGLAIGGSNPVIDIKNNVFYNTQTSSSTAKMYAIGTASTTFTNMTSSFNDLYVSGASAFVGQTGGLGTSGTDRVDLAAWNTTTGQDAPATSKSVDPVFVDPTADLHLQATSTLLGMGTPIAGITTDFDGETRDAVPDIGADEIVTVAAGTIQFSSATYSVTEGTPTVTLTVTRTGGSGGAVTANYTLGGGTATGTASCGAPGEDYVNTGGSVTFANGDAADKTFTVAICNDAVYEISQTFNATLAIGSGTATLGTPNPATVQINNDDAAPTIAINDASQAEGNSGTTNFGVVLTVNGASEVVSALQIATADNTATAPSDYIGATPAGTIPADVNRTTANVTGFNIVVNGDTNFEPNETFFVNGMSCTDCTFADNQGLFTIQNDDVQPSVQFSSATYSNSDDIAQNIGKADAPTPEVASITVTRTGATGDAFTVNYATVAGGTATAGASCTTGVDYITTSGTLSFAAGDTSKSFNVTVCTDNLFEGSETVNLALTSPSAPVILGTPSTAVLTLTDNETVPTLQFSSATYSNSDDIAKFGITTDEFAPSVATITVTRTGALDNAVSVNYATSNGTATGGASCAAGIDYVSTSGTLNFAAGITSQTFNVTVCTDALFEGNETVNLTLSNPSSPAALGTPNSAVLTIVDNDAQPSLQFSSPTYSVGEAGPTATITVTRTGASENAVSVNYATVAGGTATGGASCGGSVDYQNAGGTLNFAAGVLSQTFNVSICDDASAESSETVNLALSSPTGAVLGSPNTAVLTITDNDAAPTLQFSSASYSVAENANFAVLTVTRSGATGNAVNVDFTTGGGTATVGVCGTPGVDYVITSGTVNFASGDTSKTISVPLCNDAVYELSQTFDVTLSNATGGATIGTPNPATVTITNDDAAPTIAINDISQAEGNSGTSGFQTTFTVSGASEVGGGFAFATANNTATSGSDYIAFVIPTVVVPANVNRTTETLNGANITVNGDTTVEPDETFFLNASTCNNCSLSDNQGLATILNDDTSVQFAQPLYTVSEGVGTVTLTITRVGSSSGAIGVNYVFAPISANGAASCAAGIDFAAVSGTLNWATGDSAPKTFNVTICEDALPESTESFVSQLQSPTGGATIGAQSSTQVDITDNDSDSTAPVITYTPIPSNPPATSLTATVTDAVGVTGVNIFWRINNGSFTSAPCSPASGTPQNGTWTCIITGATNPSAVAYYVTATDGTNTATNPGGGSSAPNLFTIGAATVPAGAYTNLNLGNGVLLGGDVVVNSSLGLSGIVNAGANKISLACGATVTGGGEGSYVIGRLERAFCANETFTFNVGAAFALPPIATEGENLAPEGIISNYSPVTVTITGGTPGSSLTVSSTDAFLPGSMTSTSASRYWTLTENGNITANLSFTYRNEDVNGDENTYKVLRRSGGFTVQSISSTNNPATNTATILNVSNFSDWGVGNAIPTAANASVGGRVLTASGQGIRNATVMISGGGLTAPRYATTGTFGYYQFDGLPVGESYVVTVVSSRYTFPAPSVVINLQDNLADINFEAENQ